MVVFIRKNDGTEKEYQEVNNFRYMSTGIDKEELHIFFYNGFRKVENDVRYLFVENDRYNK